MENWTSKFPSWVKILEWTGPTNPSSQVLLRPAEIYSRLLGEVGLGCSTTLTKNHLSLSVFNRSQSVILLSRTTFELVPSIFYNSVNYSTTYVSRQRLRKLDQRCHHQPRTSSDQNLGHLGQTRTEMDGSIKVGGVNILRLLLETRWTGYSNDTLSFKV